MLKAILKNIAIYALPALLLGIVAGVFGNRRWGSATDSQVKNREAAAKKAA